MTIIHCRNDCLITACCLSFNIKKSYLAFNTLVIYRKMSCKPL